MVNFINEYNLYIATNVYIAQVFRNYEDIFFITLCMLEAICANDL